MPDESLQYRYIDRSTVSGQLASSTVVRYLNLNQCTDNIIVSI